MLPFGLLCFFLASANVTVWSLCCAVPTLPTRTALTRTLKKQICGSAAKEQAAGHPLDYVHLGGETQVLDIHCHGTLQMGIRHFSGLFVLLCVGVAGALLTLIGEHAFYRLVLPHIRRRQKFKYWLHTSQKIHRALNMTYEDVKRQRASTEKSCNIQKAQPPQPPPTAARPGATAKWNNESSKASRDPKDNKRVHFNLETLNSRRLLARATAEGEGGGDKGGEKGGSRISLVGRICENGGPTVPPSRVVLPLPPSSSPAPTPAPCAPPQEGELEELQERIEEIREQLKAALARRAELQTSLAKEKASAAQTVTEAVPTGPSPPAKDTNEKR
ncbi:hypothetical protein GJAV_G00075440 [Gymnothorax javanicus]|nr:hypothetical protein GJAV_G00075440 [Gymnothorax javanicus]